MEMLSIVLIIGIGVLSIVFLILRKMLGEWSGLFFGTSSIIDGLRQQEVLSANTPKSVSSMTRIYLPLIMKDFPEFNLFEFSQKAENMLKSVFNAIEKQNTSLVVNASDDLLQQVAEYILDLKSQEIVEHYDDMKIHKTEIHKYRKEEGTCVIIFQMAVEYYSYRVKDNVVIKGKKGIKTQTRYNVDLVYIQDINKLKETENAKAIGLNCPNCGAPVTVLGNKFCEYCGSGIKEISINTWFLNKYEEI